MASKLNVKDGNSGKRDDYYVGDIQVVFFKDECVQINFSLSHPCSKIWNRWEKMMKPYDNRCARLLGLSCREMDHF